MSRLVYLAPGDSTNLTTGVARIIRRSSQPLSLVGVAD
jgi:hypothetical protein